MVRSLLLSIFFAASSLSAMEIRSLKHTVLKNLAASVSSDLTPEFITKLCDLPSERQKELTHFILRANEERRAKVKEILKTHARLELFKTFHLDCPECPEYSVYSDPNYTNSIKKVAISSSGQFVSLIINSNSGLHDRFERLFIVDLNLNKLLYNERFESLRDFAWSPGEDYFALISYNDLSLDNEVYLYNVGNFSKALIPVKEANIIAFHRHEQDLFLYVCQRAEPFIIATIKRMVINNPDRLDDIVTMPTTNLSDFVVHPDGKCLFACFAGGLSIWEIKSGVCLKYMDYFGGGQNRIFFDPFGLRIVHFHSNDHVVIDWDSLAKERESLHYDLMDSPFRKHTATGHCRDTFVNKEVPFGIKMTKDEVGFDGRNLELFDLYSGVLEDKVFVGKCRWQYEDLEHPLNVEGQLVCFFNDQKYRLSIFLIKDIEISLPLLLLIEYFNNKQISSSLIAQDESNLLLILEEHQRTALIEYFKLQLPHNF